MNRPLFPRSLRALLRTCAVLLLAAVPGWAGIVSFTASPAVFLPGQNVTLSWSVTAGDVLTINQGVGAVSGTTGSVTVLPAALTTYTLTDSTSGTTAPVTVTPFTVPQLTHRWSFNEASGTTVLDSVGTAHGTVRGSPFTRPAGQVSLAGGSSASAAYIDLPNGLISPLTDVTFEGWMTVNGAQSWSRILDFGRTNQTTAGGATGELTGPGNPSGNTTGTDYILLSAQVGADQTNKRVALRDNTGTEVGANFSNPVTTGQQFHCALVYDSKGNNGSPQVRYYRNGTLVGQLNTVIPLASIEDVNNWLGRSNYSGDLNLNGSYNEFRLWNGPLSASGLAANVAAGPDALPLIASFTAFPGTTIYSGTTARLSYVLSGGATGSLDQGIGALAGTSGYVSVTPTLTTTYTLTATTGGTPQTATVTVVVLPGEPVAENLTLTAGYQAATPVTLIAHDPNTPAGALTYTIVNAPTNGTVTGTGANRTYTPAAGYSGADTFTYKANDGTTDSNLATVTVTVLPAPAPPTGLALSESALLTSYVGGSFAGRLQAADTNPDDTFTFALVAGAGATHNAYFSITGNQLIAQHDFSADLGQTISLRLRVTDSTGNVFETILTRAVVAPDLHVKINEVNYNPARNTQLSEFIELYNPFDTAVSVAGWHFTKGIVFTLPAGTSIAAHGYLVVAADPPTMLALYGVTALGPWPAGTGLSSDGDDLVLKDAAGTEVDKLSYGNTAPWPVPPNGDGPTLELVNPGLDNDLGGHWRASTVAPTAVSYVAAGSAGWRYRKGTSEASSPIAAWRGEIFTEDATWFTAALPMGLFKINSNNPVATMSEVGVTLPAANVALLNDLATYVSSNANSSTNYALGYRSVFFRKTFTVATPIPRAVLLRVMHNDAAIVWINGTEAGRFGFPPGVTGDVAYNAANYYERGNDPWSETVIINAGNLLHAGTNTIALQGFAKTPTTRSTQDDVGNYNVFDFSVDAELKNVPELTGTPGAQNSVFAATCPPAIRDVNHTPAAPKSWEPMTVTARVSDPQGVGSVQLAYQVCTAGNFIPATSPLTNAQLLAAPPQSLPLNPAFENAANWTTVTMVDDGSVAGDLAGDGIFTARIPAQPHRALVRYRVTATDLPGASGRVPAADDPRKNYALYVYDGVPSYVAGSQVFSTATLTTLPVYQWLTRPADFTSLLAYNAAEQFANTIDLNVLLARRFENFEGALVVGGQVVDHTHIRLRGGNSRYMGAGKRHFRFKFPKGTPLDAKDEQGNPYPRPWEEMLFNKLFGNKGYYDWGLPYEVGGKLWSLFGIPMPESHWVHFRVVQNAAEAPDATTGDFWGLYQALELPEGKNFLKARNLPLGNFFKMSDWTQNGEMDERYQAKGAPDFGEDFDNIRYNVHQAATDTFLKTYVNMPLWNRYNALQEAIRHYDIFVEPTGRHRVKNLLWYFEPKAGTGGLGYLWFMPYDWDASFGPNWNSGQDVVHNALYDRFDISDSPTWGAKLTPRTAMSIEHRNAIRELRDLVWYRDGTGRGPFDDIIDDAAAKLSAFWPVDRARWPATGAAADHLGGVTFKVQDMKNFAFTGWTDTAGTDPAVGAGGRAAYLDSISDTGALGTTNDVGQLPATPTLTDTSASGHPVDGVTLQSSAFSDPQGAGTFGALQWRIGEITDPTAPAYLAADPRLYEVTPVWESGEITPFNAAIAVPGTALRTGHTYRARVRHRDTTGRWGHWSAPAQFTATASNYTQVLKDNLVVSELMYHPAAPQGAEITAGYLEGDFEYLELRNVSAALTLNLANVRFTKGVDFDFAGSAITSLAPGATVLIVKNLAAFTLRHGAGKPIAGAWDAAANLANGGEQVKLSYGAGAAIRDFTYDDAAPWPTQADTGGYSLVLRAPETHPDHALAASWRASYGPGGSPGGSDRQTFAEWAAANGVTDPLADDDGDGLSNALEYALGGTNGPASTALLPAATLASYPVGATTDSYLTLVIHRPLSPDQAAVTAEWSPDLSPGSWAANGFLVTSTVNGDGTVTDTWRCATPASVGRYFGRVKATLP